MGFLNIFGEKIENKTDKKDKTNLYEKFIKCKKENKKKLDSLVEIGKEIEYMGIKMTIRSIWEGYGEGKENCYPTLSCEYVTDYHEIKHYEISGVLTKIYYNSIKGDKPEMEAVNINGD